MSDDLWNEDGTLREVGQDMSERVKARRKAELKRQAGLIYVADMCPVCGSRLVPLWSPSSDDLRCTGCGNHYSGDPQ